jgi:ribonuclease HI
MFHLQKTGKCVLFCWIPGHTFLPGNRAADSAANAADLLGTVTSDRAVDSDLHTFIVMFYHHG